MSNCSRGDFLKGRHRKTSGNKLAESTLGGREQEEKADKQ